VEESVVADDGEFAALCAKRVAERAHAKRLSSSRTRNFFIRPSEADYSRFPREKRGKKQSNDGFCGMGMVEECDVRRGPSLLGWAGEGTCP
jgi:hypothetical protein